jgi:foldase protein PrsA
MAEVEKLKPPTFVEDTKSMKPEEVQNIINEFVIQAYKTFKANLLFTVYAEENKITLTEEEINAVVDRFKAMIEENWKGAELSFEDVLKQHNISYEVFLNDMKKQAMQEKIMQSTFDQLTITDEELKAYYEERFDKYNQEEGAHLHIINTPTKAEAEQVLNELRSGADFHEIARRYTPAEEIKEDKAPPGDAGPIQASQIPPQLADQIFIKDRPVMTPFLATLTESQELFFVIRVKEFIPASNNTLESIRDFVYNDLMEEKKFKSVESFTANLEKIYSVKELIAPPPSAYSQMQQQMPPMP